MVSLRIKNSDHSRLWKLTGPMILSNLSIASLGLVDTAVIGHLEHAYYLGAVALGAVVFDFIYWGMGFLRMGTTGITAQVHGQGDAEKMRGILGRALLVASSIAIALLIFQSPLINLGLTLLDGSAEATEYAREYFSVRIWGAPAVLMGMAMMGWFLGMQNARIALVIGITINLLNIFLDILFVTYMDMDVRGVALASVIAEYTAFLMAVGYAFRELRKYDGQWRINQIFDIAELKSMLLLNHNLFIRTVCLIFVFAFFARQGAQQGDIILAANAILLNFQMLMALGLDGFANALEALVGQAIGRRDRQQFRNSVKAGSIWSLITAVLFTLVFSFVGTGISELLTDIAAVRETVDVYLPWMMLSPLICVWCFLLDGIYIGATRGAEMRNSMLISTFLVFIPSWYILQIFGNHGLWMAFLLFMVARGVTLGLNYLRLESRGGFAIKAF